MNIEYINPFIEASQTVLKQIGSLDAKLGKVYLKTSLYRSEDIIIMVGLTGYFFNEQRFWNENSIRHDNGHAGHRV